MRFAYWINKTTNIHSEYVIPIAFPRQKVLEERASKLRLYANGLSCLDMGFTAVYSENHTKILKWAMQYFFIMARKKCFKSDVCPKDIKSWKNIAFNVEFLI
jgi:hypothetical protein